MMKKVFVACSSFDSISEEYLRLSSSVGLLLVEKNYKIIMGGKKAGMMKALYETIKENDGVVSDILCTSLTLDKEHIKETTQVIKSINKQIDYFINCDILIFLPGGFGTLNEIFSSVMAKFSKECKGKLILVNYNHYYDELISFFDNMKSKGFINDNVLMVVNNMKELESCL